MKGTFNIQGHQVSIDLDGESWTRGQVIKGKASFASEHDLQNKDLGIRFCAIDLRKLKKKDPKAFTPLKTIHFETGVNEYPLELSPQESGNSHCLSDGTHTLGLLVGPFESPFECSQLQLSITPRELVADFLKLFETFKRCSIKSIKNKKNDIEVKIIPPKTGDLAQIDSLALLFHFNNQDLSLTYQFQIKKLTVGGAGIETKKVKSVFKQVLEKKDYLSFGQLDQDKTIKRIDEALFSWKE